MPYPDGSTWQILGLVLGGVAVGLVAFVAALPRIVRPFLALVLKVRYDLRAVGLEHLPRTGPVLVVSNHVTWFDGFFLAATLPRPATALVNAGVFRLPVVGFLARRCGLLSIPYSGPKGQRAGIESARGALDRGLLLVIFPEGQLTRTGFLGPFHRGLEVIHAGREGVPVLPVYLDNLWGSLLSYSEGRCLTKWPRGWRRTIVVAFGPAIGPPVTTFRARQAVQAAGVIARGRLPREPKLPEPIDHQIPHLDHPTLGPLTGSARDVAHDGLVQPGMKPGTVGHPLPGVAIRAVDESGRDLPADAEGRLQAQVPGRVDWVDLERRGRLDRDGFVTLN